MENLHRAISLFLLIMAAAVGVNYIITPVYDDGSTGFPVWSVLNWPMAVAVGAAFVINLPSGCNGLATASRASELTCGYRQISASTHLWSCCFGSSTTIGSPPY